MDTKQTKAVPRGIRCNNPLNIVYSPKNKWYGLTQRRLDDHFCTFTNPVWGWRAAGMLIKKYISQYKLNTIELIVKRWAPATDGNNTKAYIERVETMSGIGRNVTLDFKEQVPMLLIMSAMCVVENGRSWDPQSNPSMWHDMYAGYIMARDNCTRVEGVFDPQEEERV